MKKKRVLTGDRPTGKLHLGHYVGTLKNRVALQDTHDLFVLVADLHALTTKPEKEEVAHIPAHTREMLLDYLAVGLDPEKVTFYVQSHVPEVAYLALLFSMLVSKSEVERIPTLKQVLQDNKIDNPSLGLISYPVLQAADILMVRADLVPVGKDQQAHIEIARTIARTFNRMYPAADVGGAGGAVFPVPEALIPKRAATLVGTDGQTKMSKSLGNAIYLSDSPAEVEKKVRSMYTDPARVHGDEPGTVEGNPVFIYHELFNSNADEVAALKERYRKGTVKDVEVKEKLATAINAFLAPLRERRKKYEDTPELLESILARGTKRARQEAQETLARAKKAMGLR